MKKNYSTILIIVILIILVSLGAFWGIKKFRGTSSNQKTTQTTNQEKTSGQKNLFQKGVNVCELISQGKISELLGKKISKTKRGESNTNTNPSCFYYLEGERTVYIELDANEDISVQTKGYQALGWKVEKSSLIPMENYVIYNNEGKLYIIFLLPNSKSYVTVNPWSSGLTDQEIMGFTTRFARYLKENFSF